MLPLPSIFYINSFSSENPQVNTILIIIQTFLRIFVSTLSMQMAEWQSRDPFHNATSVMLKITSEDRGIGKQIVGKGQYRAILIGTWAAASWHGNWFNEQVSQFHTLSKYGLPAPLDFHSGLQAANETSHAIDSLLIHDGPRTLWFFTLWTTRHASTTVYNNSTVGPACPQSAEVSGWHPLQPCYTGAVVQSVCWCWPTDLHQRQEALLRGLLGMLYLQYVHNFGACIMKRIQM